MPSGRRRARRAPPRLRTLDCIVHPPGWPGRRIVAADLRCGGAATWAPALVGAALGALERCSLCVQPDVWKPVPELPPQRVAGQVADLLLAVLGAPALAELTVRWDGVWNVDAALRRAAAVGAAWSGAARLRTLHLAPPSAFLLPVNGLARGALGVGWCGVGKVL